MSLRALLAVADDLHRVGMSVPIALEHCARSGVGSSSEQANRWLTLRLQLGDPVESMRRLASEARDPRERLAAEALVICLERSGADHHRTLQIAARYVRRDDLRPDTAALALVLVALASGEDGVRAIERAGAAFGERRVAAARSVWDHAERSALPGSQAIENALRDLLEPRRAVPLRRAATIAFAVTLTAFSLLPGSADLGLAGW